MQTSHYKIIDTITVQYSTINLLH